MNHEKYALVISDIKTPQMNGFELVRQIKQIYSDINVVLITAFEVKESEFATVFPSTKVDDLVKKLFISSFVSISSMPVRYAVPTWRPI
jgi:CheY-like chemotaxis protein